MNKHQLARIEDKTQSAFAKVVAGKADKEASLGLGDLVTIINEAIHEGMAECPEMDRDAVADEIKSRLISREWRTAAIRDEADHQQ